MKSRLRVRDKSESELRAMLRRVREPVDIEAIEAELDRRRAELTPPPGDYPELF